MADFTKPTEEQLEHRYKSSANPTPDKVAKEHAERLELLRNVTMTAAKDLVELTPVSPEQTRALNALDEFWMLGQLAILRNEKR